MGDVAGKDAKRLLALGFSLLSMLGAVLNDILFKLYRRQSRPFGCYVTVIGIVWTACFSVMAAPRAFWQADAITLKWGILSGLFSVLSNLLLVRAMADHDVGICATIFRLNLAPAAVLALVLLDEPTTGWKVAGIAAAIGAVLLFSGHTTGGEVRRRGLEFVLLASLLRACMGVSYKHGITLGADTLLLMAWNGVAWIGGGMAYILAMERSVRIPSEAGAYGVVSGLLICVIVYFLAAALRLGDASVVLPVTQLSFVGTSVIGAVFLHETFTRRKLLGLLLAMLCVTCMAFG